MGTQHLVSHSEFRVPYSNCRRDGLSLHLRQPCGMGRTYASVTGAVSYGNWLDAVKRGRSYVSDGRAHLMNLTVGGVRVGDSDSELRLPTGSKVPVTLLAAAYLSEHPN